MSRPPRWKIVAAFAIVYFVWGATFLAIRVGVAEIPPFLYAAMRFVAAGVLLFAWTRWRGEDWPTRREWLACALLGSVFFTLDYGCLFWAEQRIPSGAAAVVLALMPGLIALMEIAFLRSYRMTVRALLGLLAGVGGVAALTVSGAQLGTPALDLRAVGVLLFGCLTWAAGTVFTRRLPLPAAKTTSAAAQMSIGGLLLLAVSAATGEFARFAPGPVGWVVWASLAYLIVPGSIVAFTAYLWLLHHESPTRVGTYAYVNPLVAVALGTLVGGEPLGARTVLGTALILLGVLAITTGDRHLAEVPGTELRP